MKNFLTKMKKEDGFTLVELMVVVAIIGLLSAVAVPNFKKYQAKAKISEAKLQLSAAYTAQAAFFSDFNIYHNCLVYMGFDPGPEINNRYYAVGFGAATAAIDATAYQSATFSGLSAAGCPNAAHATSTATAVPQATNVGLFLAGKGIGSARANALAFVDGTSLGAQTGTGTMVYVMGAAGVIDGNFVTEANSSLLTINENKIISVTRNGY